MKHAIQIKPNMYNTFPIFSFLEKLIKQLPDIKSAIVASAKNM